MNINLHSAEWNKSKLRVENPCKAYACSILSSGVLRGVVQTPLEIPKALQNCAKLNPIVETVKNCWIYRLCWLAIGRIGMELVFVLVLGVLDVTYHVEVDYWNKQSKQCILLLSGVPRGGLGFQPPPPKFRRPSKIVPNSTRLWKLLKIA